jgi:hypothetical protein
MHATHRCAELENMVASGSETGSRRDRTLGQLSGGRGGGGLDAGDPPEGDAVGLQEPDERAWYFSDLLAHACYFEGALEFEKSELQRRCMGET